MNDGNIPSRLARGRRRGLYAAIALSTLSVFFAIPMQSAGAATTRVNLWVSNGGNDTTNCRTKSNPCATVTYALTQAPTSGTNINLLTDIDDEVRVTKDNVTIQSSPSTSHFAIRPTTDTLLATTPAGATVKPIVVVGQSRSAVKLVNISIDGASRPSAGGCDSGAGHT